MFSSRFAFQFLFFYILCFIFLRITIIIITKSITIVLRDIISVFQSSPFRYL